MRKYKKGKQITRSKKTKVDGIQFQSRLESHMYLLFKANDIKAGYERYQKVKVILVVVVVVAIVVSVLYGLKVQEDA